MDPTREALERALVENPDDLATHAAYADYLIEQGDPRGEYIRLELLLASEPRSRRGSKKALARQVVRDEANKLWATHGAEWLGPIGACIVSDSIEYACDEDTGLILTLKLGWIDGVSVSKPTPERAAALAACRLTKLLRELLIFDITDPVQGSAFIADCAHSGVLATVRSLRLRSAGATGLAPLLAGMPRLATLCVVGQPIALADLAVPLPNLIALDVDTTDLDASLLAVADNTSLRRLCDLTVSGISYDGRTSIAVETVRRLGHAAHLGSLRELSITLSDFGDDAVEALLAGPLMSRLTALDLSTNVITDDGARLLAADPRVSRLRDLRLAENMLSPIGIEELAAVGVKVSSHQRFGGGPRAGQ